MGTRALNLGTLYFFTPASGRARTSLEDQIRRLLSQILTVFLSIFDKVFFNPRPPEPFSVTRPPKGGGGGCCCYPSLDFLYLTSYILVFTTNV